MFFWASSSFRHLSLTIFGNQKILPKWLTTIKTLSLVKFHDAIVSKILNVFLSFTEDCEVFWFIYLKNIKKRREKGEAASS